MKINIAFLSYLPPEPSAQILQLLPGSQVPDLNTLRAYAAQWGTAIITPAFFREGQYGMACVTPHDQVFQPMCFPNGETVLPGEDILPVTFPWGKLALVSAPGFPLPFSGKAGIYYPKSTGLESVEYPHPREAGMAIGRFSLSRLRNAESELFCRRNPGFDRNYCGELIKASHSRENHS